MKISELELTQKVRIKLSYIFDDIEIYEEVGLFNRNIDMLLLSEREIIFSIEFKLNNWRKAIEQIEDYMLISDYTYLCMPERKISKKLESILIEKGIGLLLYNQKEDYIKKEILPKMSHRKIDYYKYQIINKIKTHKELYRNNYV